MIPVYEPLFGGNEKKYLRECINSGWVSSDGPFVKRFEEAFAKWAGTKYAVAVSSGTAALEVALWSLKISSTFVAMPASTIISCAVAVIRTGCMPTYIDMGFNNWIDEDMVLGYEKAVILAHLFGRRCKFKNKHKYKIIDDCSQYWKPIKIKDVGVYSLYANKLITGGEGGVLVTNKKYVYENARRYRNLCHTEERFIHDEIGYNFRMSNLQAAVALAQLEQIDKFIEIKKRNYELYKKYLPSEVKLIHSEIPWMYLAKTTKDISALLICEHLRNFGIDTRRFFYPLNAQPCFNGGFNSFNAYMESPNSSFAWQHLFYLPSGLTLTKRQIKKVCKCLEITLNTIT